MPIRNAPRREPRVLALSASRHGLCFAVADPWEIRSAGFIPCAEGSRDHVLDKLARREKPTAITGTARLRNSLRKAAQRLGLSLVSRRLPHLPLAVAADLYPELDLMAPQRATKYVAGRAIAAALHANIPSRHYATRRH